VPIQLLLFEDQITCKILIISYKIVSRISTRYRAFKQTNNMRLLILISVFFFFAVCNTVCGQSKYFKPKYSTVLELTKGKKLLLQCSRETPKNISEYWNPTNTEIEDLESNFLKLKEIKSTGCCFAGIIISDLPKYCYQYTGVIINNKKYIYINAFEFISDIELNTIYKEWLIEPVIVCDGGDSFFGVLYDLNIKIFLKLNVNGVG
jgi:hypothetical protein